MKNNRKGFTLIELLVVVLILGILAAMAMPQYFKAVERSRMSEAVSLLGSIAGAQQRKYLQIGKYIEKYDGLDVVPAGATGNSYTTSDNGFTITLSGTGYTDGVAKATRSSSNGGTLNYNYNLTRYYASNLTQCNGTDTNGKALCADFCGTDTPGDSCCSDGTTGACTAPTTGNAAGGGTGGGN